MLWHTWNLLIIGVSFYFLLSDMAGTEAAGPQSERLPPTLIWVGVGRFRVT